MPLSVLIKAQGIHARNSTLCPQPASRLLPESGPGLASEGGGGLRIGVWVFGMGWTCLFPQQGDLASEAPRHIPLLGWLSCKAWELGGLGTRRKLKAGETAWRDPL